jgi:hypothetical protein
MIEHVAALVLDVGVEHIGRRHDLRADSVCL